jgi:hypothetical protein
MLSERFTAAAEELLKANTVNKSMKNVKNELANLTTVQEGYKNTVLYT